MLKEYLEKTYGYNEPIFISDLQFDNMNDNSLRQYFKRMVKSGDLVRFDTGIYYLPKTSRLLSKTYMDPLKVIIRKYIKNDSSTFGYFSGAFFANQIGLTTQMPAVMEIVTNKESTKGRIVTVGGQSIRLKRPAVTVTQENAELLQVIDAIGQMDRYAELEKEDALALYKNYIREKGFSQTQLTEIMPAITGNTAKKLIEGGLIYEFTSG
ncbi:DUF6088 family protein [Roseburia hominis]